MSKLIDRLHHASEGTTQPLGFGAVAQKRVPVLALVAHLTNPTKKLTSGAIGNGAEFILVPVAERGALPKTLPPAGVEETPWGVKMTDLTEKQHATLKEAGCDFVVIPVEGTPVRLLNDEAIGFVVTVPATTEDRWLRAIDQLPLEVVVVDAAPASELTLKLLLDYTVVSSRVGQHLLATASLDWGEGEVEQLRELGFSGLLVEIANDADLEKLKALRDAILALPARSRRRDERTRARLPQVEGPGPQQREVEEPDEDDDDDY